MDKRVLQYYYGRIIRRRIFGKKTLENQRNEFKIFVKKLSKHHYGETIHKQRTAGV